MHRRDSEIAKKMREVHEIMDGQDPFGLLGQKTQMKK